MTTSLRETLRRRPAAAFVVLTLIWSWGVWSGLLFWVGRGGLTDPAAPAPAIAFVLAGVGGIGPSLVGLLLAWVLEGREGVAAVAARLRQVRLGRWWWVVLVVPMATAVVPAVRAALGHPPDGAAMARLLLPGLALGVFAGMAEEIGWRGWLLPELLRHQRAGAAALWVGLVWGGLWHGYADWFGIRGEGWHFWLMMALQGPLLLTAWSVLLTAVHRATGGSLAASVAVHASISSSALVLAQTFPSPWQEVGWTAVSVAVAWMAAALVWRQAGRQGGPALASRGGVRPATVLGQP